MVLSLDEVGVTSSASVFRSGRSMVQALQGDPMLYSDSCVYDRQNDEMGCT